MKGTQACVQALREDRTQQRAQEVNTNAALWYKTQLHMGSKKKDTRVRKWVMRASTKSCVKRGPYPSRSSKSVSVRRGDASHPPPLCVKRMRDVFVSVRHPSLCV